MNSRMACIGLMSVLCAATIAASDTVGTFAALKKKYGCTDVQTKRPPYNDTVSTNAWAERTVDLLELDILVVNGFKEKLKDRDYWHWQQDEWCRVEFDPTDYATLGVVGSKLHEMAEASRDDGTIPNYAELFGIITAVSKLAKKYKDSKRIETLEKSPIAKTALSYTKELIELVKVKLKWAEEKYNKLNPTDKSTEQKAQS